MKRILLCFKIGVNFPNDMSLVVLAGKSIKKTKLVLLIFFSNIFVFVRLGCISAIQVKTKPCFHVSMQIHVKSSYTLVLVTKIKFFKEGR